MENPKSRIIVLASAGMGHLIPLLELSKRLVNFNSLHVTLFVVSTKGPTSQSLLLSNSHHNLDIVELTPPNASVLASTNVSVEARISMIMSESMIALRSQLTQMNSPPSALIVDIFGVEAFAVADEFGIPKYVFVTSTAWFLALTVYVPTLDKEVEGEYVDLKEVIQIPGCKPVQPQDVVDPMLDRTSDGYKVYVNLGERLGEAKGILLNSWEDLEPHTLAAFKENNILMEIMKPRVYPIGPIFGKGESEVIAGELKEWLGKQPGKSVVYISLGSGGTLSYEQMTELAFGLELSQQRFIWVVRPPTKSDASGTFFTTIEADPSEYLPEGFLDRVKGWGMVIQNWAPQGYILGHMSTGGFVSHCGWNSTLESLTTGVPMIAWPLYAEQRMNAAMLVEELGVAVRPESLPTKKVVSREVIEKMVRMVMLGEEGKKMRERVEGIKKDALNAVAEGGQSYNSLLKAVQEFQLGRLA